MGVLHSGRVTHTLGCNVRENEGERREGHMYVAGEEYVSPSFSLNFLFVFFLFFNSNSTIRNLHYRFTVTYP
jgi:hypothetical protein